jgi:hypothetical protein
MNRWEKFSTFKHRGEWVELLFMAAVALRGFNISKPWGDSASWDVGVDREPDFLRVQVKSTTKRTVAGYSCDLKPGPHRKHDYTLDQLDLFAAYVIPENIWYLIPAAVLLGTERRLSLMLCPVRGRRDGCKYEHYREAWGLLGKSRSALSLRNQRR